jgi:hypothetical protein
MGRGGSQRREMPYQNHGQGTGRKGTVGQRSELHTEGIRDRERTGERKERIRKGGEKRTDSTGHHTSQDGRGEDCEQGQGGGDGDGEATQGGRTTRGGTKGTRMASHQKALNVLYLNAQSSVKKS